jgi:hypothetical protein
MLSKNKVLDRFLAGEADFNFSCKDGSGIKVDCLKQKRRLVLQA